MHFFYDRSKCGRWAMLFLALAWVSLGFLSPKGIPIAGPPAVTSFHQFYNLAPEQASNGMPVRLKGVVLSASMRDGTNSTFMTEKKPHGSAPGFSIRICKLD